MNNNDTTEICENCGALRPIGDIGYFDPCPTCRDCRGCGAIVAHRCTCEHTAAANDEQRAIDDADFLEDRGY